MGAGPGDRLGVRCIPVFCPSRLVRRLPGNISHPYQSSFRPLPPSDWPSPCLRGGLYFLPFPPIFRRQGKLPNFIFEPLPNGYGQSSLRLAGSFHLLGLTLHMRQPSPTPIRYPQHFLSCLYKIDYQMIVFIMQQSERGS